MKSPINIATEFLSKLGNKIKNNPKITIVAVCAIIVNFIDAFITFHFKRIILMGIDVNKPVYKFIKTSHIFTIVNIIFFALWDFILGKLFIA